MAAYCENCNAERKDGSKVCPECGKKVGGELWALLFGIIMGIVAPIGLYLGVKTGAFIGGGGDPIKILIPWELAIWTATATLYDHNRFRSKCYFWIGGALTAIAAYWAFFNTLKSFKTNNSN